MWKFSHPLQPFRQQNKYNTECEGQFDIHNNASGQKGALIEGMLPAQPSQLSMTQSTQKSTMNIANEWKWMEMNGAGAGLPSKTKATIEKN